MQKTIRQHHSRTRGIITIVVASLSTAAPAAEAAEIYLTPRIVGYFDNFMSLDSSISANPDPAQGQIDALNDALRSILGPLANLSIASADISLKSEQAAYTLGGASLEVAWEQGENQNRWIVTALTGDAEVRTDLLSETVVNFSLGPLQAQDVWSSREVSKADLDRLDLELSVEYGISGNLALVGGARYERVEFDYVGRQRTQISQNLINVINTVIGDPIVFGLGVIEGTTRGTVRPEMYSARFGLAARSSHSQQDTHSLFASAQLHLTYTPASDATSVLTPDDPSLPAATLHAETEEHWSAGPDIIVGYEYSLSDRVRIGLRYRATVYFPISGYLEKSDPRVNHGANLGIAIQVL